MLINNNYYSFNFFFVCTSEYTCNTLRIHVQASMSIYMCCCHSCLTNVFITENFIGSQGWEHMQMCLLRFSHSAIKRHFFVLQLTFQVFFPTFVGIKSAAISQEHATQATDAWNDLLGTFHS